jgi:hypothetical protein
MFYITPTIPRPKQSAPCKVRTASTRCWLGMLLAVLPATMACDRDASPAELKSKLVGQYHLVFHSTGTNPQLKSSELTLSSTGESVLRCQFKDGSVHEVKGQWDVSPPKNVFLSRFEDCAGVFGTPSSANDPRAASLIVELSNPPVIVLDPDIVGVFYERLP